METTNQSNIENAFVAGQMTSHINKAANAIIDNQHILNKGLSAITKNQKIIHADGVKGLIFLGITGLVGFAYVKMRFDILESKLDNMTPKSDSEPVVF